MSCKAYGGLCVEVCGAIGKLNQDLSNNGLLLSRGEDPMTLTDASRFVDSCKKMGCFGDKRELKDLVRRFPERVKI